MPASYYPRGTANALIFALTNLNAGIKRNYIQGKNDPIKMISLGIQNLSRPRQASVLVGVALLILATILFGSVLLGLSDLESFAVLGNTGLRTLAGIAVAGCLLAAIGYYNE